ncbi:MULTISPECIES: hypothetical protein [Streptomyces]|uniref:Tryptophan-rich sensory protein n=1 Tax=Streptomyces lycii TaxID=2654337 RepID=A0ABQ7FEH8_9ACTN|nr:MULTISPECIES: hypothetical protein [Streptomyces]KAF4406938.1 hypothetical protein GCU69_22490 [Streptomyces lycii]PGH47351.1 hypothetical protein CRI70_29025 [Streptomyces sp. Ru87]
MTEPPGLPGPADHTDSDGDEASLRPGPLWRHALWVAGVTAFGAGMAWANASHRVGPDEYGIPLAVPGQVWPYLLTWIATGLTVAAALRAAATRVPLVCPEVPAIVLTFMGARLSLGWRPEPPALCAMVAVALTVTVVWCAVALRHGLPGQGGRRVADDGRRAG